MLIKRIALRNIRSYREADFQLPLGKTLFEGDIGSGKSTILMAMEFALFGLGSTSGSSLLRLGCDAGEARVLFELDAKEYEVRRTLVRKSGHVHQGEGSITADGIVLDLSASEIKEKMLELLHFNEDADPKAQSWIFRYAVYTPQEEMKKILSLAPSERRQILRRAFGVEDYSVAAENAEELGREVRKRKAVFDVLASEAPALRDEISRLAKEKQELEGRAKALSMRESKGRDEVEELKVKRRKLEGDSKAYREAASELALCRRLLENCTETLGALNDDVGRGRRRLAEAERKLEGLKGSLKPVEVGADEIAEEVAGLEAKRLELLVLKTQATDKLGQYDAILQAGVCPVCEQDVRVDEFGEKKRAKSIHLQHVLESEAECEKRLGQLKELARDRKEYDGLLEKISEKEVDAQSLRKDVSRVDGRILPAEIERKRAEARVLEVEKRAEGFSEVSRKMKDLDARIEKAEALLNGLHDELVGTQSQAREREREASGRRKELEAKEAKGRKGLSLGEHRMWVEDFFIPTLDAIEKQVMAAINQEFNSNFQRWFEMLVDDPEKEVTIDEDFTPEVLQQGYDQDLNYLSGGEKTSVSLAYRLALNTLVQKVSTGMKSNLLILDEPTDGFSKEQLGNVREVLDDVGSPQVVIVSHDKELESFADQIFRVRKQRGESRLQAGE